MWNGATRESVMVKFVIGGGECGVDCGVEFSSWLVICEGSSMVASPCGGRVVSCGMGRGANEPSSEVS
jgi:hypothetical protein